jgi:hypothetical protein
MNTASGPEAATSAPLTSGPTTRAALNDPATMPLAHVRSSSSTRLGIVAADAALNGAPAAVAAKTSATNSHGASTASTPIHPTPAASALVIITRRRSNRSPIQPETGPRRPVTATNANRAADTQADEPVRW